MPSSRKKNANQKSKKAQGSQGGGKISKKESVDDEDSCDEEQQSPSNVRKMGTTNQQSPKAGGGKKKRTTQTRSNDSHVSGGSHVPGGLNINLPVPGRSSSINNQTSGPGGGQARSPSGSNQQSPNLTSMQNFNPSSLSQLGNQINQFGGGTGQKLLDSMTSRKNSTGGAAGKAGQAAGGGGGGRGGGGRSNFGKIKMGVLGLGGSIKGSGAGEKGGGGGANINGDSKKNLKNTNGFSTANSVNSDMNSDEYHDPDSAIDGSEMGEEDEEEEDEMKEIVQVEMKRIANATMRRRRLTSPPPQDNHLALIAMLKGADYLFAMLSRRTGTSTIRRPAWFIVMGFKACSTCIDHERGFPSELVTESEEIAQIVETSNKSFITTMLEMGLLQQVFGLMANFPLSVKVQKEGIAIANTLMATDSLWRNEALYYGIVETMMRSMTHNRIRESAHFPHLVREICLAFALLSAEDHVEMLFQRWSHSDFQASFLSLGQQQTQTAVPQININVTPGQTGSASGPGAIDSSQNLTDQQQGVGVTFGSSSGDPDQGPDPDTNGITASHQIGGLNPGASIGFVAASQQMGSAQVAPAPDSPQVGMNQLGLNDEDNHTKDQNHNLSGPTSSNLLQVIQNQNNNNNNVTNSTNIDHSKNITGSHVVGSQNMQASMTLGPAQDLNQKPQTGLGMGMMRGFQRVGGGHHGATGTGTQQQQLQGDDDDSSSSSNESTPRNLIRKLREPGSRSSIPDIFRLNRARAPMGSRMLDPCPLDLNDDAANSLQYQTKKFGTQQILQYCVCEVLRNVKYYHHLPVTFIYAARALNNLTVNSQFGGQLLFTREVLPTIMRFMKRYLKVTRGKMKWILPEWAEEEVIVAFRNYLSKYFIRSAARRAGLDKLMQRLETHVIPVAVANLGYMNLPILQHQIMEIGEIISKTKAQLLSMEKYLLPLGDLRIMDGIGSTRGTYGDMKKAIDYKYRALF